MKPYRILIVDDEVEILHALSRLLRDPAHDIRCAATAEEAMSVLDRTPVDLIICDFMLGPGINGLQVLEKVSSLNRDIIGILLTGYADVKVAVDAINTTGLYKFILKPWDNGELVMTIRRALEQRSLILENRQLTRELLRRDKILREMEKDNPGISQIKRDQEGRVVLN
jgi:DNA-binding NtrC family response regulator